MIEGRPFQVQWFERNRLELHPENPRPYDVLLGRLGVDRLNQQARDWFTFPKSQPQAGCQLFAQTGHSVCGDILAAWHASGVEIDGQAGKSEAENLALFGLPLSDAQAETIEGREYIVQWFERARFEIHPENQPPYNVLLGLLGNEVAGPGNRVVVVMDVADGFYPSGWMGDLKDLTLDDHWSENPHSAPTCIRISYTAARSQGQGWAGIYWQYPENNWGNSPEGHNLTGATRLTFWARGEKGGERAEFKVGGITGDYPDSLQPPISTGVIVLLDRWQQYTIDLTGKNLSHVIGGFVWVTNVDQNPQGSTIYLDDIRYEQ
jgi:hypothetical protein